jgi:hypothetical protein
MVQAGVAVFREWEASDQPSLKVLVQTLYLAMAAQAPALPPDPEAVRQYRADALRRAVGKLVNDGKCADAQGLAVKNGDFDLANEVKAYCSR